MSFFKHLLPGWRRQLELRHEVNESILEAIDKELTDEETEAIESKAHSFLHSATGEWLDKWGDWFGVVREENQSDEEYREEIVRYTLLKRSTIPSIIDAIQHFLKDYESYIEIYEPYRNVFYLNRSHLNGEDKLLGHYYRTAVIHVKLSRHFPIEIIDVINAFKPAGVKLHLSFESGTYDPNAPIVEYPPYGMLPSMTTYVSIMNGLSDISRGLLTLAAVKDNGTGSNEIFHTNSSLLNSDDVLAGSFSAGREWYNFASIGTVDVPLTHSNNLSEIISNSEELSPDFYNYTGSTDNQVAITTIDDVEDTYLYFTLDVGSYTQDNNYKYLQEITGGGQTDKNALLELIDNPVMQYKMNTLVSPSNNVNASLEVYNFTLEKWQNLQSFVLSPNYVNEKYELGSVTDYISNNLYLFTRIVLEARTESSPYDFQLDFYGFGFKNYIATRNTIRYSVDREITGHMGYFHMANSIDFDDDRERIMDSHITEGNSFLETKYQDIHPFTELPISYFLDVTLEDADEYLWENSPEWEATGDVIVTEAETP